MEYVAGEAGLSPGVVTALERLGISRLYCHQGEALDYIRAGKDLLVATPTASGKTLIYNLPVLEESYRKPPGHALYLFPLKALDRISSRPSRNWTPPSPTLPDVRHL